MSIAKKYLIDKEVKANGLTPENIDITEEALYDIIQAYTREAGVRSLEKSIATLCRKAAVEVVEHGPEFRLVIDRRNIASFLGQPRYRHGKGEDSHQIGTTTGLAWTDKGGELLTIETAILPGKGRLQITGKLGDVMQESAKAALSYVRSRAAFLGLPKTFYDKVDIHVHVPEGAIPKDGPSAGITMATSLVSALTGIPVNKDIAMTGEITLRGNVLPIGGLKEKALAAHRGGIKKILLPKENENEIEEIPPTVRAELEFVPVSHVDEVLFEALQCSGLVDFQKLLERKATQDILLFEDEKPANGAENGRKETNGLPTADVVTH